MNEKEQQFDQPELKAAMKRIYPEENAPETLRKNIIGLIAPANRASQTTRPSFWATPMFKLAAAIFVIALAGLIYSLATAKPAIDEGTIVAMIATHDWCCKAADHRDPMIPQTNFKEMGSALSMRLHEPVLAADLRQDGWTFHGARMCSVDNNPTAHLTYWRGAQRMSVFSYPVADCKYAKNGARYAETVHDHLVAGFVTAGAVYCLVGNCPAGDLKLPYVNDLLQKHRTEIVASALARDTNRELLYAMK